MDFGRGFSDRVGGGRGQAELPVEGQPSQLALQPHADPPAGHRPRPGTCQGHRGSALLRGPAPRRYLALPQWPGQAGQGNVLQVGVEGLYRGPQTFVQLLGGGGGFRVIILFIKLGKCITKLLVLYLTQL